jgi:Secretion system C-terminal sorting domain
MKSFVKLFVAVFFILGVIKATEAEDYFISGRVRYADNNELVTHGVVKAYDLNGQLLAQCNIQTTGDWIIIPMRVGQLDVIGIPDDEWEDGVPTGYPNTVNPAEFVHINVQGNTPNVDIYVQRGVGGSGRPGSAYVKASGLVLSDNVPVKDAIVYATRGGSYYGYGMTNSRGEFSINNLPEGDFILVAHKIAHESDSKGIFIGESGMDNIVFNVVSKNIITNNNPVEFKLSQNYPNPFNPNTVINYSVPKDGMVTLRVYNTSGQLVSELMNAPQTAGSYSAVFNANGLSSGVYFYTIAASGYTDTKKMILVK